MSRVPFVLLIAVLALLVGGMLAWRQAKNIPNPPDRGTPEVVAEPTDPSGEPVDSEGPSTGSSDEMSEREVELPDDALSGTVAAPAEPSMPTPASGIPVSGVIEGGPHGVSESLNRRGGSLAEDLDIVQATLVSFRTGVKKGNPVGLNREITATLAGRNAFGLAWVRPDHPAINEKGELCDRWGTPFFFHQESASRMTVRSAGPDREMFTDDDGLSPETSRGPRPGELKPRR